MQRYAAAALLVLLAAPLLGVTASAAYTPRTGDFFEYHFHRHVGNGGGEYEGYADDTNSDGHYEVTIGTSSQVTMHTHYRWSYTSNDAPSDDGVEDRTVTFNISDRRFTSAHTDNDELDGFPAHNFAVWFWINPDVRLNEHLLVFDNNLTVTSLDATIWLGMSPVHAIKVEGTGSGSRSDNYGTYTTQWTDTYYFDGATGWFVAERYVEHDRGTWQGSPASFTWTEDIDFQRGSYSPPGDTGALLSLWGPLLFAIVGLVVLARAYRARGHAISIGNLNRVRVAKLKEPARLHELMSAVPPGARGPAGDGPLSLPGVTQYFGDFLEDFAQKGASSGDAMAVATAGKELAGFALYNKEGDVGAVFAENTAVAEELRRVVRAQDFFAEWRHHVARFSAEYGDEAGQPGVPADSYNLVDTYDVLRLSQFPASGYDATLVSRMRPEDLGEVSALLQRVFNVESKKWLAAQVACGDVAFVARVEGRIAGVGLASSAGRAGRLHTLAVLPEFRDRGIGRELVRARLSALESLGAHYVLAEVARWNIASLELLYAHGFGKVGNVYVETARMTKPSRQFVRR